MIFFRKSKKTPEEFGRKVIERITESGFRFWRGEEFRSLEKR